MDVFEQKKTNYTVSEFECKRDNLKISGIECRPQGDKLPAAIVCHGLGVTQDFARQYVNALAEIGYAVYSFDFCGGSISGSKSDGETTDMSVLTELEDLRAVIEYVKSLPYTDDSLLLMGCSQGGFVSGITAARNPGLVDKLVLFFPAINIPDDARAGRMLMAKFDPENIPEIIDAVVMKLGRRFAADVIDMDSFAELKPYSGPVLIVHGTADQAVPVEYSKRLDEIYANSTLVLIENGDHGFTEEQDVIAIEKLVKFAK